MCEKKTARILVIKAILFQDWEYNTQKNQSSSISEFNLTVSTQH